MEKTDYAVIESTKTAAQGTAFRLPSSARIPHADTLFIRPNRIARFPAASRVSALL